MTDDLTIYMIPAPLADAMRDFQRATLFLAEVWDSYPGDMLGDSYGDLPSFDSIAASVAGWEIS